MNILGKKYKVEKCESVAEKILQNTRLVRLPRKDEKCQFEFYLDMDLKRIMTKRELVLFGKWMHGQTCSMMGYKGKQYVQYYADDVHRFFIERYGGYTLWD